MILQEISFTAESSLSLTSIWWCCCYRCYFLERIIWLMIYGLCPVAATLERNLRSVNDGQSHDAKATALSLVNGWWDVIPSEEEDASEGSNPRKGGLVTLVGFRRIRWRNTRGEGGGLACLHSMVSCEEILHGSHLPRRWIKNQIFFLFWVTLNCIFSSNGVVESEWSRPK